MYPQINNDPKAKITQTQIKCCYVQVYFTRARNVKKQSYYMTEVDAPFKLWKFTLLWPRKKEHVN